MPRRSSLRTVADVVRELGYLTLGSPLKRVDERLQGHAQALLEAAVADACAGAKGLAARASSSTANCVSSGPFAPAQASATAASSSA